MFEEVYVNQFYYFFSLESISRFGLTAKTQNRQKTQGRKFYLINELIPKAGLQSFIYNPDSSSILEAILMKNISLNQIGFS